MKWRTLVATLAFAAATTALSAQQPASSTTVVTGPVVQYTPGQTIVLRDADGKMVTFSIGSGVQVPAGVQVGKTVSISSEPASDGSGPATVTRIETTTVDASGQMKTTSERTEQSVVRHDYDQDDDHHLRNGHGVCAQELHHDRGSRPCRDHLQRRRDLGASAGHRHRQGRHDRHADRRGLEVARDPARDLPQSREDDRVASVAPFGEAAGLSLRGSARTPSLFSVEALA